MVMKRLCLSLFFFCAVIVLPLPVDAVKPGADPSQQQQIIKGAIFMDGAAIADQVDIVRKGGEYYIPLDLAVGKIGFKFNQGEDDFVLINHDAAYIPAALLVERLGYTVIGVDEVGSLVIFSGPLVKIDMDLELTTARLLRGYFNHDIYRLPKDLKHINVIYADYIHPDYLDAFTESLYAAITTPTGWGATEYVDSKLIAQTENYAVMYYQIKFDDGCNAEYLYGLWSFKKYRDQWLMIW